jgi:hypothetical protein
LLQQRRGDEQQVGDRIVARGQVDHDSSAAADTHHQ